MMVLSFFLEFSGIPEKNKSTLALKPFKISEKSNGNMTAK